MALIFNWIVKTNRRCSKRKIQTRVRNITDGIIYDVYIDRSRKAQLKIDSVQLCEGVNKPYVWQEDTAYDNLKRAKLIEDIQSACLNVDF